MRANQAKMQGRGKGRGKETQAEQLKNSHAKVGLVVVGWVDHVNQKHIPCLKENTKQIEMQGSGAGQLLHQIVPGAGQLPLRAG